MNHFRNEESIKTDNPLRKIEGKKEENFKTQKEIKEFEKKR